LQESLRGVRVIQTTINEQYFWKNDAKGNNEWKFHCIFLQLDKMTFFFLVSDIKAGGTDVPKVSNIQTKNVKINRGLRIPSVCKS
jgi:hypothetical protein